MAEGADAMEFSWLWNHGIQYTVCPTITSHWCPRTIKTTAEKGRKKMSKGAILSTVWSGHQVLPFMEGETMDR